MILDNPQKIIDTYAINEKHEKWGPTFNPSSSAIYVMPASNTHTRNYGGLKNIFLYNVFRFQKKETKKVRKM